MSLDCRLKWLLVLCLTMVATASASRGRAVCITEAVCKTRSFYRWLACAQIDSCTASFYLDMSTIVTQQLVQNTVSGLLEFLTLWIYQSIKHSPYFMNTVHLLTPVVCGAVPDPLFSSPCLFQKNKQHQITVVASSRLPCQLVLRPRSCLVITQLTRPRWLYNIYHKELRIYMNCKSTIH